MIIFQFSADLQSFLKSPLNKNSTTCFVPTMGALHSGHISLLDFARKEAGLVICSIFVNPTQFNDPKDFEKYPSTIEKDIYLLEKADCDVLFLPAVAEIYPAGVKTDIVYELGQLETILEGKYRPGHFQGVCQVMHRLLNIVGPDKLFLGQKDFQQCMVIKRLIELMGIKTQIIICPTSREPDGLAMSSRNLRLNEAERQKAPGIYHQLHSIKEAIQPGEIDHLKQAAVKSLTADGFKVDYVEIAFTNNLEPVSRWDGKTSIVTLAAAYLNEVRLIDNIIIN